MTVRNHFPLDADPGLSLNTSNALDILLGLNLEAQMLGARIETARQDERGRSLPSDRVTFRPKRDRGRTTLPHGPSGERRRSRNEIP